MNINSDLLVDGRSLGTMKNDLSIIYQDLENRGAVRLYYNTGEVGQGDFFTYDLSPYKEFYIFCKVSTTINAVSVLHIPYKGLDYQATFCIWLEDKGSDGNTMGDSLIKRDFVVNDSRIWCSWGTALGLGNHGSNAAVERSNLLIPYEVWGIKKGRFYN